MSERNDAAKLERLITQTRRAAEPYVRILIEAPDAPTARQLWREFQNSFIESSRGFARTVPLANQTRIGPLAFVLHCLVEPEEMFNHRTDFLDAVRELCEKQELRRQPEGSAR